MDRGSIDERKQEYMRAGVCPSSLSSFSLSYLFGGVRDEVRVSVIAEESNEAAVGRDKTGLEGLVWNA